MKAIHRMTARSGGELARANVHWILAGPAFAMVLGWGPAPAAQRCTTIRASVGSHGNQGNGNSVVPDISADGRFVFFSSISTNLVPGDTGPIRDVFAHDRDPDGNGIHDEGNGITTLISISSSGVHGNGPSMGPRGSENGRHVVFCSEADNLVPADTNGALDAFLHDRLTSQTVRVSVDSSGNQANGETRGIDISADGKYVVFGSEASNLVPNDNNGVADVFLHEPSSGQTMRVSVSSQGWEANGASGMPSLSGDGRYVCFLSAATNLVPGDGNAARDVFVHDRWTGRTVRASVSSSGVEANADSGSAVISAGGNHVAFESTANNLVPGHGGFFRDVFLRELAWGRTIVASAKDHSSIPANGHSWWPRVSADGRFVAFQSIASDLVPGDGTDLDVFVRDCLLSTTELYSADSSGVQANGQSTSPAISLDGRYVAFQSFSDNLVSGDTNWVEDIFVRSCLPPQPTTYCLAKPNSLGCMPEIGSSGSPSASAGSIFLITAFRVVGQRAGLLFYSRQNSAWLSFQGGHLCVAPPLRRTPVQVAGGSSSVCNGAFSLDFNAWMQSGQDPALDAGDQVWAQYWSRDPGYPPPQDTGLTNAITFVVGP